MDCTDELIASHGEYRAFLSERQQGSDFLKGAHREKRVGLNAESVEETNSGGNANIWRERAEIVKRPDTAQAGEFVKILMRERKLVDEVGRVMDVERLGI